MGRGSIGILGRQRGLERGLFPLRLVSLLEGLSNDGGTHDDEDEVDRMMRAATRAAAALARA